MGKLLNQKSAIKLMERHGWTNTCGGKHNVKMAKDGSRPVTLPKHKGADYSLDLTRAICKQAGIDHKEL